MPAGAEGWVLKGGHYRDWWKVKPTRTADLVVTGFREGRGKYTLNTGALVVSAFDERGDLVEVASVSGMTDEIRDLVDEEADLGRVCEVEYQYVGAGGRLRHPRFRRWRDDKPREECTLEQLR